MATVVTSRSGWDDLGKLILRLTVAGLMLFHGVAKVKGGVGFITGLLAQNGLPGFLAYGVYVLEIVAPILLILGLLTRLAALGIVADMVVAIGLVLRNQIFSVRQMGGGWAIELEMFFLLTALAIFFFGSGRYGLGRGRWD
jgi:putative oxidoreductase